MEEKTISRRQLIVGSGKVGIAAAALSGLGGMGLLAGCGSETSTGEAKADMSKLPWAFEVFDKADMDRVVEIAHENWFSGFCSFATFSGIVTVLRDKVGEPYTSFPMEVMIFAHGGTAGWGGTCGTLIGAGLAATLAAGPTKGEEILNDVMKWYSETELPKSNPPDQRAQLKNTSRADSSLCHISVGKWMDKEGVGFLSPEQMERCARLSADVATKTVELLNAHAQGSFMPAAESPVKKNGLPSQFNCTDCHGADVPVPNKPGGGESLIKTAH